MQTSVNTSITSQVFSAAPPDSVYGKIHQNNMDDMSYTSSNIFQIVINNRKNVGWTDQLTYLGSKEFSNCQVLMVIFIRRHGGTENH